ncbi:hypothetical protein L228DRAFT_14671 [Xylona heveae TC161]|uniref:Uncharacterized protein n=1 Tax=Xylona heveae (strain CBS 132557 / TC161) TaxID=1328760 RepID=A0A165JRB2_XYLHT|nr:hypothetical protein L228DRAFT_14671 [Xylona heveae TC161]KZF26537.1 hypothetical protein L228DRAFT_14671 [Xylona heveae TC161]
MEKKKLRSGSSEKDSTGWERGRYAQCLPRHHLYLNLLSRGNVHVMSAYTFHYWSESGTVQKIISHLSFLLYFFTFSFHTFVEVGSVDPDHHLTLLVLSFPISFLFFASLSLNTSLFSIFKIFILSWNSSICRFHIS